MINDVGFAFPIPRKGGGGHIRQIGTVCIHI